MYERPFARLRSMQGVHIPTKAEIAPEKAAEPQKKKIVYVDKKKLAKKQQQQQAQQANGSHEPSPVAEDVMPELASKEATPTEGGKTEFDSTGRPGCFGLIGTHRF